VIRAYVDHAVFGAALNVSLVWRGEQPGDPRRILRLHADGDGEQHRVWTSWEALDPDVVTAPTLTLGHDEAIALMGALHTHYQGVDDQRMLRKDYDAERGRVDKMIGALIEIKTGRGRDD